MPRRALLCVFLLAPALGADPPGDVLPVLRRCVSCHGGDEPAGGLDLTTRAGAVKGGESGPALSPGKADKSLLFRQVEAKAMPPKKPLSTEEIAALRRWIDAGAAWEGTVTRGKVVQAPTRAGPNWWSLQPLGSVRPPAVRTRAWVRTPVDAFVLAGLEANRLAPAPPADRAVLLRRVTFDLTGLPPTPEEIADFVNDPSPSAWEKVVDRLLASPHHGERWARHWLDAVRFCESQGFERDKLRENAWRYRDYVVGAFNSDLPYPQFVREQIAGDLADPPQIAATGFLVAGPYDEVGLSQQGALMRKRAREEELEDMVSALGQVFLGLTVHCARCHNHKFDPIPQRDYYRLKAAIEGVRPGDRPLLSAEQLRQRGPALTRLRADESRLSEQIATIERRVKDRLSPEVREQESGDLPRPIARWRFEGDVRDSVGQMHGKLAGGARVEGGRLQLDGKGAFVKTAPLHRDLTERTMEVWVTLANLDQRGGGVMTVQDGPGRVFDAIVYAEREPREWIAGSNSHLRTSNLVGGAESAESGELVHLVITWRGDRAVEAFRNGRRYGVSYTRTGEDGRIPTFAARDGHVLFGLRHTGAGNGFFAGAVEEARLYDRVLTSEEVAGSYRAGVDRIPFDRLLPFATPREKAQGLRSLDELEGVRRRIEKLDPLPVGYVANPSAPEPTFVYQRGDVEKPDERVSAGGLSAVKGVKADWGLGLDAPEADRRKALAKWIASPDNPLTARVIVNRIWQHHFGNGLVPTPSDFGFNGGRPSHPELLDWLAGEFVRSGGSLKQLHRLIVLSSAYQQSSRFDAKAAAVDADNRWLWRYTPRRLEAEAVRDAMLAASGTLNRAVGGPSFRPFAVKVFNSTFYTVHEASGPEFDRRTLYRMNVNSARSPLLESLDCPDPSVKTPRRAATTTPLQALALMNSWSVLSKASALSARVQPWTPGDVPAQVTAAFRLALGRKPTMPEQAQATKLANDRGLEYVCWALFNSSEFLYLR